MGEFSLVIDSTLHTENPDDVLLVSHLFSRGPWLESVEGEESILLPWPRAELSRQRAFTGLEQDEQAKS